MVLVIRPGRGGALVLVGVVGGDVAYVSGWWWWHTVVMMLVMLCCCGDVADSVQ